ncbi:MAG: hypothetical protein KAI24_26265 [Planctomycetes bacterium]|nr:hypothetical protein [Planctomycetota bacterium]
MKQGKPAQRFEVFLDESGQFMETSHDRRERQRSNQRFPSQLAGILAPAGAVNRDSASRVLGEALGAAGIEFQGTSHAVDDLRKGETFDIVISKLADCLSHRRWRPVRLVNTEGVSFGNREENYTNLVAELCLRLFAGLRREGFRHVELALVCARVVTGEDADGKLEFLERPEYVRSIQATMMRAALRAGRAEDAQGWRVASVRLASARTEPELMVCDLVSNASHSNFGKLGGQASQDLRAALGGFDFSLQVREDLERLDAWTADGAYGFAVVHLAERLADPDLEPKLRQSLEDRLQKIVASLASLGAPARNPQLEIVCSFLEETVRWIRDLDRGRRLIRWMTGTLIPSLTRALAEREEENEIAWFAYAVQDRAVETCNHLGDLSGASKAIAELKLHEGKMVTRWEHVDRFLQGQIHEAVHLTDAREFAKARDKALRVADFHEQLGSLFQDALPEHFSAGVRSKRRGEALGTALQAEAYRCLAESDSFDSARELSDLALEEFDQSDDRTRQMQYRCQLETMAGEFDTARQWLCRSMGIPEDSDHGAIATHITSITSLFGRGFLILHWMRLGAFLARRGRSDALDEFTAALEQGQLDKDQWFQEGSAHPRQTILRYRTEIALACSDEVTANTCLNRLREACLPIQADGAVLGFQLFACQVLVAHALPVKLAATQVRSLIENAQPDAPGLRQLLKTSRSALCEHPQWERFINTAGEAVEDSRSCDRARPHLQRLKELVHRIAL